MATKNQDVSETIRTTGDKVIEIIKNLIHEGNIRSITVQSKEGKTVFSFPLTLGVVGAVISAPLMILATLLVLGKEYIILVEKTVVKEQSAKVSKSLAKKE